jgi:DNA-binding NarL/FixJ family response regulator
LAEALGAAPLLEQIGQLAKVAHIPLDDAAAEHDQHAGSTAPFGLTERELQVLALVVAGRTNRQIGAALYMSPKTASVHVTHILQKLGVHSRVEAATVATRLGIGASR